MTGAAHWLHMLHSCGEDDRKRCRSFLGSLNAELLTAGTLGIHDAAVILGSREKVGSRVAQGHNFRSHQVPRFEAGVYLNLRGNDASRYSEAPHGNPVPSDTDTVQDRARDIDITLSISVALTSCCLRFQEQTGSGK